MIRTPSYPPKSEYSSIFTRHIWSWLLCSHVVVHTRYTSVRCCTWQGFPGSLLIFKDFENQTRSATYIPYVHTVRTYVRTPSLGYAVGCYAIGLLRSRGDEPFWHICIAPKQKRRAANHRCKPTFCTSIRKSVVFPTPFVGYKKEKNQGMFFTPPLPVREANESWSAGRKCFIKSRKRQQPRFWPVFAPYRAQGI